jgi:methylmalonyl-CoA/ethylmalonyl-CoA epimerase
MPGPRLAHICFLVRDLDAAVQDWTRLLRHVDPAQLEQELVREEWVAGDDVMESATFVKPDGTEIQLLAPLNDGPLGQRLAKHGEGVHHICFTNPDLPAVVAGLVADGVELTSTDLQNDPQRPWQYWTFIRPQSSHGTLVELAYPYRALDGRWHPDDVATAVAGPDSSDHDRPQ